MGWTAHIALRSENVQRLEVVVARREPLALPTVRVRLPRLGGGAYLFWASSTLYLSLAIIIVLQLHLIVGDAWSRVGNAYYVLFSRDPHLAAIGFVWNPLPSLLEMPLVLFRWVWPPIVEQGFAASLLSAACMGGAVYVLHAVLRDWRVPRLIAFVLALLFAVHPMIVHYGLNGDTEALFLLLTLIAVRYLSRWFETAQVAPLVLAGLAIGLAYWTRYETVAVGAAVIGLVAATTFARTQGNLRERTLAGAADAFIVGAPFTLAFVTWTLASWIIVGNPFEQFSSVYGTASQLETGPVFVGTGRDALDLVIAVLQGFEPAALAIGIVGLTVAVARRDARWLAPVAVLGSVLAFAVIAWLAGKTGGWIRYYIAIVPLTVLLSGLLVSHVRPALAVMPSARWRSWMAWIPVGIVGLTAIIAASAAVPSSWATMRDRELGRGESNKVDDLPQYVLGASVSEYLDGLQLGDGEVLIDVFLGFPIVLESDRPGQFVITPDRDFKAVVADPYAFGVRYILVPPGQGLGQLDAIRRQWPYIYESGAGIGTLVREFEVPGAGDAFRWRLYELTNES